MSDDFGISATIGADDSGFQAVFDNVEKSLSDWGLDFGKLYDKGEEFFKGFGVNIDQLAGKLGTSGEMLTAMAGVGVVVAELGKQIFEVGVEFDEASSDISKATGATGDSLTALNGNFEDLMGLGIEQNMSDVATAFSTLSVKLDLTGEPLENLTKSFADYADVAKISVTEATKGMTDVMNKWDISAKDAPELLDQITKAAQLSGASQTELTSILKTSGAQLQTLGLSLTDSVSMLAAFEKGGVNTNTVMKGFQTAIANAASEGENAGELLQDTFDKITNAKTPTDALTVAVAAFGTKAGTEMANALSSGKVSITEFQDAISKAGGTVEETGEASETLGDKWAVSMNKIKSAVAPLGDLLVSLAKIGVDAITEIVDSLKNILEPTIKFIKEEFDTIKTVFETTLHGIGALVKGDWSTAWTDAQIIVLTMVKNIADLMSTVVNTFIGMVNNLITSADKVLDKVNLHINTIKDVSLSAALGIDTQLTNLKASIEKTGESSENLGKKTGDSADKGSEKLSKASALAIEWDKKVTDAYVKNLDTKESSEITAAEKKKATLEEVLDIAKKYDDEELAYYKKQLDEQEKNDLADAVTKKATTATIATIKKYYEDQITAYQKAQIDNRTALETTYTKTLQEDSQKKTVYEAEWADKASSSAQKLNEKQKTYTADSLAAVLDSVKKQEEAEVAKATALGASDKTIANIHKTYQNEITQDTIDAKDKQLAAGLTVQDAWQSVFNKMTDDSKTWTGTVQSIASTIQDDLGSAFESMGEALANGESGWSSFAKVALQGLAKILESLGLQLIAMAVSSYPNFAQMAISAAAGIAAEVAAGLVTGYASSFATGSEYTPAGKALVGESGAELVDLPQGSRVLNATQTASSLSGNAGSNKNVSFTINAGQNLSAAEIAREVKRVSKQMAFQGVL